MWRSKVCVVIHRHSGLLNLHLHLEPINVVGILDRALEGLNVHLTDAMRVKPILHLVEVQSKAGDLLQEKLFLVGEVLWHGLDPLGCRSH